jgi:hypothetical protein
MSGPQICSQSCRITTRRAVHLARQQSGLQHQQRHASSSSQSPSYHLDDLVSDSPRSTRYSRPRQKPATPASRQPETLYDYVAAKSAALLSLEQTRSAHCASKISAPGTHPSRCTSYQKIPRCISHLIHFRLRRSDCKRRCQCCLVLLCNPLYRPRLCSLGSRLPPFPRRPEA